MSNYDIQKVINIALNEVGYLEKASNKDLDDKTANAGKNNYTKYWRDMNQSLQGQAWCNCFVNWCFVQAYGAAAAKNLLCSTQWSYYTPTSANYFKQKALWFSSPAVGDIIYFKNSTRICHVGIVYKIDATKVYTIEGNTSGGSTLVANGGGVAKKSYALNYTKIAGYGRPQYSSSPIVAKPTLKIGSKGSQVYYLQNNLNKLGAKLKEDGDFGKKTYDALIAWQAKYSLTADGIYGNNSYTKMKELIK